MPTISINQKKPISVRRASIYDMKKFKIVQEYPISINDYVACLVEFNKFNSPLLKNVLPRFGSPAFKRV
uniref:DUF433 domain-containing protein n=1 Tax=Bursaphelenchus xylophilus TaxID=6326 RepID=A0A1I7SGY0_BURXY